MSVLTVENLSQRFIDKQLYQDASFQLNKEDHMGIIGQNGVGKSTLIKILTGTITPDEGKITWQRHLKVGYLDQYANLTPGMTVHEFLRTAFAELDAKEKRMNQIYTDYAANPDDELLEKAGLLQEALEAGDFYEIDTKIEQVATGLGLDAIGPDHKVDQLSGGQRSKIILAKLLLERPDVLLLDEPTNYLDTNHIDWLSDYLNDFEGAFIVVSHDYEFLKRVTNSICDIEFGQITKYTGDLEHALRQKEANHKTYMKAYEHQQQHIEKTKAYIRKFKAGTRSKSAKSREKQLARLDVLTPPGNRTKAHFEFPYQFTNSQILLLVNDLVIGYDKPLLKNPVNFTIGKNEKVVLKGFNGIGKSTLLKTILGIQPALSGDFEVAETVQFGYFEQELEWDNDHITPLQFLMNEFGDKRQKELRQVLARTGLTAEEMVKPVKLLSGGEQVKVKLAALMLQPANLLVLDEPTNHLDDDTKDSLRTALKAYEGAVLLVTHEEDFYDSSWVDHVLDVEKLLK
ncbi:hypothetical protein IV38_GL001987 [Lactobacillus selangorensis]|uniref:ABC transporter domain-containing protein n=1 Tax=Lactobacillus selangorensis TaxID=81857 RepID=A0A0R2FZA4_9LACO|nr:ABC-F family ATP-binding cassette domain-containing protein [Lactobacillus selangorensis]KRN27532.1 hypothetical protein IV38_GL001987 [Lactobacillus selangorensis]KRN30196.1 hypothetical protein IV40_GL002042 [Lactobacillus selangorensis]